MHVKYGTQLKYTAVDRYSKEFFPPKASLVKYLNDFTNHYKLNVKYNTHISEVTPPQRSNGFTMQDQHANVYNCSYVYCSL